MTGLDSTATPTVTITTLGFYISTTSLPTATISLTYGPVTLQAAGLGVSASPFVTTLKWKKLTPLPRGLRMSSAGVLSGTAGRRAVAGQTSVTVQVTESVTTLNGTRTVKTKTTAQATIPLTVRVVAG